MNIILNLIFRQPGKCPICEAKTFPSLYYNNDGKCKIDYCGLNDCRLQIIAVIKEIDK